MSFDPIRNPSDEKALSEGCHFDESQGQRVCDFIEKFCRQSKGRWAGQPIVLIPWERDLLMRAFGWRKSDGRRRFKVVHVEVPKKNGKSTLTSALCLYLQLADGEAAAEVYLNAVDREQANIVFEEAVRMVEASPQFSARLNISRYHGTITDPKAYGVIKKNSADAPSKDGVNASGIIFDEIHRFAKRELWDVFTYAGISREQPIKIVITTAGEESEGVWHELREHSEKVNAGAVPDTTHLGVIFRAKTAADEGGADDLDDPETWKKVNPSMGYTMTLEDFSTDFATAKAKGGAEWANFVRLRLGIVMRAEGKYLQLGEWEACGGWLDPDSEAYCYMGLDLSDRNDLTALVALTGSFEDGFALQARFWLPRDQIVFLEGQHGVPYRQWADEGYITLTDGNTIDYDFIEEEIVRLAESRNLYKLFTDPWNAKKLAEGLLNNHGLPVEYIRQGYASISDATKTLHELILGQKIHHGGNPIMKWHASNAVVRKDPAGNIKLDKEKSRKKIDGMAALVNATASVLDHSDGPSVYATRGVVAI